jgi:hypothetical protein
MYSFQGYKANRQKTRDGNSREFQGWWIGGEMVERNFKKSYTISVL